MYGKTATFCLPDDINVCYSVVAAQTGDDIFIQMRAPSTYGYVGLGTGTSMTGSTMFIMYAQSNDNVTVSARTCGGHMQPQLWPEAQVVAKEGTAIESGEMRAVVKCKKYSP